jgi:hypothetical protein
MFNYLRRLVSQKPIAHPLLPSSMGGFIELLSASMWVPVNFHYSLHVNTQAFRPGQLRDNTSTLMETGPS